MIGELWDGSEAIQICRWNNKVKKQRCCAISSWKSRVGTLKEEEEMRSGWSRPRMRTPRNPNVERHDFQKSLISTKYLATR